MTGQSNIRSYRDLEVWRRSKAYAVNVYRLTENFPKSEVYGLTSQIRRAAVSVPSNIAEGFRRKFRKEKLQFLRVAYGSGSELETQLEISFELGYLDATRYQEASAELDEIMRMMNGVINSIERSKEV